MVLINPSITGSVTAGSLYTLTCIALKTTSGLTQSVQTQWTGPSGTPVIASSSAVLAGTISEPLRTIHNITFNSLYTRDAGVYSCESTLSSPALTTSYQTAQSYAVTVSGIIMVK